MKPLPKLVIRVDDAGRAYCARRGCPQFLGTARGSGDQAILFLESTDREAWIRVNRPRSPYGYKGNYILVSLYVRRRRRRLMSDSYSGEVQNWGADVMAYHVVECPTCRTHQRVSSVAIPMRPASGVLLSGSQNE